MRPQDNLKCLLVHPRFALSNFWNFKDSVTVMGAKASSPPLGLLTVAALLPQNWEFRLVDMNVKELTEDDWQWADMICTGGMLPQQEGILAVVREARQRGKYVAVGGADPTSQPDIYAQANVCVLGEGEITIPMWLKAWSQGTADGVYESAEKPDVTKTPIPRFDLVNFNDYMQVTVQYSRGCPFNCEFCDIIELYGRVPRGKTNEQFIAELEYIYSLGYTGWIDIVDDNFIGNKRNVKKMLPDLLAWCEKRKFPFFFSTEASMNLGDDVKLMEMMRAVDFRFVFLGIETPDPELLLQTQKSQNTMKPIVERVHNIYRYGMTVFGGFILGFDNEKPGVDKAMIRCIEDSGVTLAMVGLLVALPNTQLSRRLMKEGRLLDASGQKVTDPSKPYRLAFNNNISMKGRDNTSAGLNFVPTRPTSDIIAEFCSVVGTVYDPKVYMDRVYRAAKMLGTKRRHRPGRWELRRSARGFWNLSVRMTKNPLTRRLYWKNILRLALLGVDRMEIGIMMMGSYLHLQKQTQFLLAEMKSQRDLALARESEKKTA